MMLVSTDDSLPTDEATLKLLIQDEVKRLDDTLAKATALEALTARGLPFTFAGLQQGSAVRCSISITMKSVILSSSPTISLGITHGGDSLLVGKQTEILLCGLKPFRFPQSIPYPNPDVRLQNLVPCRIDAFLILTEARELFPYIIPERRWLPAIDLWNRKRVNAVHVSSRAILVRSDQGICIMNSRNFAEKRYFPLKFGEVID
jgi:hypothetical protein